MLILIVDHSRFPEALLDVNETTFEVKPLEEGSCSITIVGVNAVYLRFICARLLAMRERRFHLFFSMISALISCLRARYVSSFFNFS